MVHDIPGSQIPLTQDTLSALAHKASRRPCSFRYKDDAEILDLIKQRRRAMPADKHELSMQIVHLRKEKKGAWQLDALAQAANGNYKAISYLKCRQSASSSGQGTYALRAGGMIRAVADLRQFYAKKYESRDPQVPGVAMCILAASFPPSPADPEPLREEEVLDAVWKGKVGKSAGGDGVSYEFLQSFVLCAITRG